LVKYMKRTIDMLIRIKNAYMARQKAMSLPYFRLGEKLAKILVKTGYLTDVKIEEGKEVKDKIIKIGLVYKGKEGAIRGVKIISKPGLRVYVPVEKVKKVMGGKGISIISTSCGLMTGEEAKKKNLGGEMIAEIW